MPKHVQAEAVTVDGLYRFEMAYMEGAQGRAERIALQATMPDGSTRCFVESDLPDSGNDARLNTICGL
jgi:hypothetical protein